MTSIAPPSYTAALMDDKIDAHIDDIEPKDASIVAREQLPLNEVKGGDVQQDSSHLSNYTKGFPEDHYLAWSVIRVALMVVGIPIGCRRNRHIICHGHGGSCGRYSQDRPCRLSSRSGCCKSNRRQRHCERRRAEAARSCYHHHGHARC